MDRLTLSRQAGAVTGDSCFLEQRFLAGLLTSLTCSPQALNSVCPTVFVDSILW
jgi:hypothetical protein